MGVSITELIDTEILNTNGTYFRNRDIVMATGASRSLVSQRIKYLWDEGILESHGQDWTVLNAAQLVVLIMKRARDLTIFPSKTIKTSAKGIELLIDALQLLESTPSEWEAPARQLRHIIVEDIDTSINTLRNFKTLLKSPDKSKQQVFMHMARSGDYAADLQNAFIAANKLYTSRELDNEEVITETIRPPARAKYTNKD